MGLKYIRAGGAIERWEDGALRACFADILRGDWKTHDPYDLDGRINARSSMYGRENQVMSALRPAFTDSSSLWMVRLASLGPFKGGSLSGIVQHGILRHGSLVRVK